MPLYKAPVEDYRFLLNDVFHVERYADLPGYSDLSPELIDATLSEAAKLCEQVLAPLNRVGDAQGCTRHEDGSVTTPKGFKEAFDQFRDGGWGSISFPTEFGGQSLPVVLAGVLTEFLAASNLAFWMYPGLTQGAVAALLSHGSSELKATYLPNLIACKWMGTMNLTEAHCGTDLGMLRTKAKPQPDGTYRITGTKIFISAGEHDLAENIVHLVLARIEGAPAGVKGISLFVVPKFLPKADGTLGARNTVSCGSIEHKMGIHGNCTCVMNFDNATGWLVGDENHGLNAMFTMMNHERLGVGTHGVGLSDVAYQNAVVYAKDRLQGRSLSGKKFPDKPADPIIVHPDVRRMLMIMRATTEAARALLVWTGLRYDIATRSADEKAREQAEDHMGLMTPVIKGVCSDLGLANAVMAQQIWGGHGYIAENGMDQFVRDARINEIYEGANGIQALDLVGRKLAMNGGRAVQAFFAEVDAYLKAQVAVEGMAVYVNAVRESLGHLQLATQWLAKNAGMNPDNAGAGSYDYMHLFGLVALGYMWCRIVEAARGKITSAPNPYLSAKLVTARFFVERILPESAARLARIKSGADSTMALPAEAF
ncbi:MAG: acyl-CoA dehydrogenase C-terminal domain-containing protein [Steroidobacteraceae bacterium]